MTERRAKWLIWIAGTISLLTGAGAVIFNLAFDETLGTSVSSRANGADLVLRPDLGGDRKVFVELEVQESHASSQFAAHLEDTTLLTVEQKKGIFPGRCKIGIYAHNAAATRGKFTWPSGVNLVLTDGGTTAPILLGWQVSSEKNRDESSDQLAARAQHRAWLAGFQIIAVLGTLVASWAAVFKVDPPPSISLEILDVLIRHACQPRSDLEREGVAFGEEVLRRILQDREEEGAALASVTEAAGARAREVAVGYILVRMRLMLAWRRTDFILDAFDSPGAAPGGRN